MNCPADIAEIVLEILDRGVLRIRSFAGIEESKKCVIEADHVHNLPALLADYRADRLRYYWDRERHAFMKQVPENERRDLMPLWDKLAVLMDQHGIERQAEPHAVRSS